MITAENIIAHEMIGLKTEIVESSNPQIIQLNGTIIDETKSMFTLKTKKGLKKIPKANSKWKFVLDHKCILNGSSIAQKPHERLRKA